MRYFFILFPCIITCQSLILESKIDTNYAKIGDVILWTIIANQIQNKKIHFPELKIENEKLSIINNSSIIDKKKIIGIKFEIILWDTGSYETPDYSIDVLKNNGELDYSIKVDPNRFYVASVITDTTNIDFRPLKGPLPVKPILPIKIIVILILLLLIFYLMIILWKKRKIRNYKKVNYLFLESPKERAIKRMENLNSIKIPKDYYSEISRISKKFIEEKFFIYALEMTTQEIESNRFLFPLDDKSFSEWISILHQADLVKYASNSIDSKTMIDDKEKLDNLIRCIL